MRAQLRDLAWLILVGVAGFLAGIESCSPVPNPASPPLIANITIQPPPPQGDLEWKLCTCGEWKIPVEKLPTSRKAPRKQVAKN
jgi:hypothetical protein